MQKENPLAPNLKNVQLVKNHISRGVAQPGSASALGADRRRFKSCHPDHKTQEAIMEEKKPLVSENTKPCAICKSFNTERRPIDGDRVSRVVPYDRIKYFSSKGAIFCCQCGAYQNDTGFIVYLST